MDGDGHAFAQFITEYLSEYNRWNSPKYLFGESYGTTRSAVLARYLETEDDVDLNGVVLLSQILSYDISNDDNPESNPGMDLPYELALPTYAATAWYHHKLPGATTPLPALLSKVESFALGDYAQALNAGTTLSDAQKQQVAQQLSPVHRRGGVLLAEGRPAGEWRRVRAPAARPDRHDRPPRHAIRGSVDGSAGAGGGVRSAGGVDQLGVRVALQPVRARDARLQARHALSTRVLRLRAGALGLPARASGRRPRAGSGDQRDARHGRGDEVQPRPEGAAERGYFDLATPFYAAVYAMHHLALPPSLAKNISYADHDSGHMVYADLPSLKKLHDNVAKFIESTSHESAH